MTYVQTLEDQHVIPFHNGALPSAVDKCSSNLPNQGTLGRYEKAGRRDALCGLSRRRDTPLGQEAACHEFLLRALLKFKGQHHWTESLNLVRDTSQLTMWDTSNSGGALWG